MTRKKFFNADNLLIAIALTSIIVLVFTLVSVSKKMTTETLDEASHVINTQYQKLHNLLNLQLYGQKRNINLSLMLLLDDAFARDEAMMAFYQDGSNYVKYRDQLAKLIGQNEQEWYQGIQSLARAADPLQESIAELALEGQIEKGKDILANEGMQQLSEFGQRINDFSRFQSQQTQKLISQSRRNIDQTMHQIVLVATLLVLVSFFFAYLMARRFHMMNLRLKVANDSLEKKVKHRTQRLTEAQSDLLEKNRILERLSTTDALTQLHNRLKIERILETLQTRYETNQRLYTILFIDIDFFKAINDSFGHHSGDLVLKDMARCLRNTFTEKSHIGRWGGEEFIVILEEIDAHQAVLLAEECRQKVQAHEFPVSRPITVSIGLATIEHGETTSEVIHLADMALYDSKHAGRNRVTVYSKEA